MLKDYDLQSYYSDEELAEMFGDDDDDEPSLSVEERNPNLAKS